MEGIITLIVLIIIFNLFNFLARALKGNRFEQERRVLVEKEDSMTDSRDQTDYGWEEDVKPHGPLLDLRASEDYEDYRGKTSPKEDEEAALPPVEVVRGRITGKKNSSSQLAGNLRHLITKKDPLLTAFIFHEIIDPPRTRRRKV